MKKAVVLDWDNTLAYSYSEALFPGADELIYSLTQNGIEVAILTARPGSDPCKDIFNAVEEFGIKLENIIWVGEKLYQGDEKAGADKAEKIEQFRQEKKLEKSELLFADDSLIYCEAARSIGIEALQAPYNENARIKFFQSILKACNINLPERKEIKNLTPLATNSLFAKPSVSEENNKPWYEVHCKIL